MSLMTIFFASFFFIGIFLCLKKRPIFGLYTYLFAFYLGPSSQWWGKVLPDLRWSLFSAVVTMISIFLTRKKEEAGWFEYPETRFFSAFVVFVVLQSFSCLSLDYHLEYVFLSIKFLILIFMIQGSIKTTDDLTGFILANLIGCAYFGYLGFDKGSMANIGSSGLENTNQIAQHMGVILVFSSFLLLTRMGKKNILIYPLLALVLNGIILAESRSVIIAMVVTALFALFNSPRQVKSKFYIYVILGGVAFGVLLGPGLVNKMDTILGDSEQGVEQDRSAESRLQIIKGQWEMFKDSPFIGYGHRGTLLLSPEYINEEYRAKNSKGEATFRASHNFLMALLVDHGVIGTMLYLTVIWLCIKKIFYLKSNSYDDEELLRLRVMLTGLIASLVCLMIAGLGSNNKKLEIDIWLYALIPLGYNLILLRENKLKKQCQVQTNT